VKRIPIYEAKALAEKYGYDQIVILGKVDKPNAPTFKGWSATFNKDKSKCKFLGIISKLLSYALEAYYNDENVVKTHLASYKSKGYN
jgi:hypothetical protein